jgi:hypothetical protein
MVTAALNFTTVEGFEYWMLSPVMIRRRQRMAFVICQIRIQTG